MGGSRLAAGGSRLADEVTGWRVLDRILIVFRSFSPNGVYAGSVADRGAPTVMIDLQRQTIRCRCG